MESVIRFIYKLALYAGLFVCGSAFLFSIIMYVMYNGIGNVFKYVPADNCSYILENDTAVKRPSMVLKYQYRFRNQTYNGEHSFFSEDMRESLDSVTVYCNTVIPSLSMVKGVPNSVYKQRHYLVHICISFLGVLFTFLIWRFADHDKWIGVYARGEYKSKK